MDVKRVPMGTLGVRKSIRIRENGLVSKFPKEISGGHYRKDGFAVNPQIFIGIAGPQGV